MYLINNNKLIENILCTLIKKQIKEIYLYILIICELLVCQSLQIQFTLMNISGNTRVITQNALQTFQEEMAKVKKDPYKVIMRQTKLPITLLNETAKV